MMINGHDEKDIEFNKCENEDKKTNPEDFLKILNLMAAVGARNADLNAEEEMKEASIRMGKVLYSTYSGMLLAGFDKDQAFDLTKCLVLGVNANPVLKR